MHTKKQPYVMGLEKMVDVDLDEVDTVTLPVVFHIVHTGAAQENNVSDQQILSQLDVLNEEFEDSKIQFCMAVRDLDGNLTNGITVTMQAGMTSMFHRVLQWPNGWRRVGSGGHEGVFIET